MTAWINGFLGVSLIFWLGSRFLGLSYPQILHFVAVDYLDGMLAPFLILTLEARPWVRKHILTSSGRTWIIFSSFFFGFLLVGFPPLRSFRAFTLLVIPALLATGFSIITFGPLQDALVRKRQIKAKTTASQN